MKGLLLYLKDQNDTGCSGKLVRRGINRIEQPVLDLDWALRSHHAAKITSKIISRSHEFITSTGAACSCAESSDKLKTFLTHASTHSFLTHTRP